MSRLPTFFLAGAPKAGTTSLFHYLDQHPEIFMSSFKEPCFFSPEIREEYLDPLLRRLADRDRKALRDFLNGPMLEKRFGGIVDNWEDYLRLFANATTEKVIGEGSVCYLWSPSAPERIAETIPNAKILIQLRDPSDRAFSQYIHGVSAGFVKESFREHIERSLRNPPGQISVCHPLLDLGLYSAQVSQYLDRFGSNVWIGFYDDFRARPIEVFQEICRFLDVDPSFVPQMNRRYLKPQVPRFSAMNWLKHSGLWAAMAKRTPSALRPFIRRSLVRSPGTTQMDLADRSYLIDFYREDIRKLAALLGRNLDAWLLPTTRH